jgi:hypothetical protein
MACYHSINGITNNINNLKGAAFNQQQGQQEFMFPQTEVSLLTKTLELSRLYVTRNPQFFQEPQEMLQKIDQGIKIISSKTKSQQKQNQSSLKGASLDNKVQSLVNIRNMFGLGNNNNNNVRNNNNQLKGASKNNNNNICSKTKSLTNLREHFNLI